MPASNNTTTTNNPDEIRLVVERTPTGVQFTVRAPVLEDFFRALSSSRRSAPRTFAEPSFGNQHVYMFDDVERDSLFISGCFYETNNNGRLLDGNGSSVNLAPLCAVGIGSDQGVTFTVRTVLNKTQLQQLADGYDRAIRHLYLELMAPARHEITFTISRTQMANAQL